jgi:VIT1/CCC1 family predicted Fe2+/Mn2+ transporter
MTEPAVEEIGHTHADVSGGWLRPAVFGAMDGLILAGMASLVAGAFSMALGEFTSVDTQNNAVEAEVQVEREELLKHPEAEEAELVEMYMDMGLSRPTATVLASEVHENPELAVKVHVQQELGVDPDEQPSPWTAAFSSFATFAVGALIPLIPFLLGFNSLALGLTVGGVGLFTAGALVSRFTARSWWFNGIRQLSFGAIAAGATYLVGALIGVSAVG